MAANALPSRVASIDYFRGMTMIWMFSSGFGLRYVRDISWMAPIERQFTHADWNGMYSWDMIQPFFMFIVGAAMPFSFAKRSERGDTWSQMLGHVLKRCLLLFLLGTAARSISAGRPVLDVINVLGQLSFTYLVAFLVFDRGWRVQAATAAGLLGIHWAAYVFLTGAVLGAPEITGAWDKNANFGWWLDGVILGKHWGGGYATINCVSSAANTIFGVMAGAWLRDNRESIRPFVIWGAAGIAGGLLLDPLVPINKKIWTASFALVSTGITLWALALFIWLYDLKRQVRPLSFSVVGMNSIFIYMFHEILHRPLWLGMMFAFGWAITPLGGWGKLLAECALVALQIAVCWWLYARKLFFRI